MTQESAAYTSHHKDPTASGLLALHIDAVGEGTDDDGNISDDSASDISPDVSDGESYVEKWYGGNYEAKRHMRSQSVGSQGSTGSNPFKRQVHHWRSQPPLLPERLAAIVSSVSGATRLSLEITALFWEAVFDTIAESTSGGIMLGSVVWEEAKAIA
ncbi:hypothetical protein GGI23_007486, partial [Coemansia sp. RSA 2559]